MIDQPKASALAREAFEQWQAGHHAQSRQLYEQAICFADPAHYGLSDYYGQYACVLRALGQHDQALTALEKALETEIAQGNQEDSPSVIVARYFLAHQLRRMHRPEDALGILTPSIRHAPGSWLTRVEEAQILFALDRRAEAKAAAGLALAHARTPGKAAQLTQHLQEILESPDA